MTSDLHGKRRSDCAPHKNDPPVEGLPAGGGDIGWGILLDGGALGVLSLSRGSE